MESMEFIFIELNKSEFHAFHALVFLKSMESMEFIFIELNKSEFHAFHAFSML